jgi:hypothetical protein
MADDASSAVTTFAQYESAVKDGKFNASPAPAPEPASDAATTEETPTSESAAESETVEDQSVQTEKAEAAPALPKKPPAKATQKLSLSDEHARLLREVVELRKERRELQQPQTTRPPAPEAGTAAMPPPVDDDKPPVRPKLSTFPGSLEEYEKAVEKYDDDSRAFLERQWQRKQDAQQVQADQQRITRAYGDKLAEHLKTYPDYDAEIAQTPMTALMVDIVLHTGPELGQILIDDKDEAKRIQALPRDVQIFEMGKLAARTNGNGASAASAVSEPESTAQPVKVPAKVGASGGSAAVLNRPDHGAKNFAEFEAIERRLAKKGK